jgi:hypothetical protein
MLIIIDASYKIIKKTWINLRQTRVSPKAAYVKMTTAVEFDGSLQLDLFLDISGLQRISNGLFRGIESVDIAANFGETDDVKIGRSRG